MSRAEEAVALAALLAVPTLIWPIFVLWSREAKLSRQIEEAPANSTRAEFQEKLHAQLLDLSSPAYERLIAQVLRCVGYENVRVLRAPCSSKRSHKGRNRHGGYDISALVSTEFSTQTVLIQVKQYERPISRRFVDELRGALIRTQAHQGLLITTSTFAPRARQAASEDHIGPIHLIDGVGIQELLVRYSLGVGKNRRGLLYVQKRFFRRLEQLLPNEPKITWERV